MEHAFIGEQNRKDLEREPILRLPRYWAVKAFAPKACSRYTFSSALRCECASVNCIACHKSQALFPNAPEYLIILVTPKSQSHASWTSVAYPWAEGRCYRRYLGTALECRSILRVLDIVTCAVGLFWRYYRHCQPADGCRWRLVKECSSCSHMTDEGLKQRRRHRVYREHTRT